MSANPPSFSQQTPKQIQETRVAGRAAKRRKEADSDDDYKPPIKLEKPNQKGLLPKEVPLGLKLPILNPTPVHLALSLMKVESVPNISMKKNRNLQILTLP